MRIAGYLVIPFTRSTLASPQRARQGPLSLREPSNVSFGPLRVVSPDSLRGPLEAAFAASPFGPFEWAAAERAQLRFVAADAAPTAPLPDEPATIVVLSLDDPGAWLAWLRHGAADVVAPGDLGTPGFAARVRATVERRRLDRESRRAYATDLDTGLPHRQQLVEHMSHLMALREREPAPMAVLVLRIEGLETTAVRYGREAANVLRRKLAVRLRAGVRSSDVVASLGDDRFAVLLAALLAPGDAAHVGSKLRAALQVPFKVSGHDIALAVAVGAAGFPDNGSQPEALLGHAGAQAAATAAQGRTGHANFVEGGGRTTSAANDD